MKELSIKEKAKRYDEAIERAKECHIDGLSLHQPVKDVIEHIFPELKESEDERIRKSLIILLQHFCKGYRVPGLNFPVSYKDMLAWLEKQGEQEQDPCEHCKDKCLNCHNFPCIEKRAFEQGKSVFDVINEEKVDNANKVEPKFKVGDWLCENESNKYARFIQILETVSVPDKEGYYKISRDLYNDEDIIDFNFVEKFYHKFDIKNAKDGDVLSYRDGQWIFIYKGKIDDSSFYYHTLYSTIHQDLTINDAGFTLLCDAILPATKEQRDLLFQKMKEAGYEWDAEKKELKKIEQNPTWDEDDECYMSECIGAIATKDGWSFEEKRKTKHWLKSLKERCTWKPSDEQIKVLHDLNLTGNVYYAGQIQDLISLYNDLKKLREE